MITNKAALVDQLIAEIGLLRFMLSEGVISDPSHVEELEAQVIVLRLLQFTSEV